jgi:hypothetical protein
MSGGRTIGPPPPGVTVTSAPARIPAVTRDQTFQDIYANQIRLGILPSDMSIIFGVTSDRGPGVLTIEDKATIRMAPVTAKILFLQLKVAVEAYEKSVGEIVIPTKVRQQIEAHEGNLIKRLSDLMAGTSDGGKV